MTAEAKMQEYRVKGEEERKTLIVKAGLDAGMLAAMVKDILQEEIKFVDLKNLVTLAQVQEEMTPPEQPMEAPEPEIIQQQETEQYE